MVRSHTARAGERGYAMVALLVGMSIMAVALSVALPAWSTAAKREREAELIFRGQQYARAIALFQRKNANVFPPSFDVLVQGRFLRKRYKDPMAPDGEFQPVYAGQVLPGQAGQTGQTGQRGGVTPPSGTAQRTTPQGGTASATQLGQLARQTQLAGQAQGSAAGRGGIAGGVAGATPGLIGVVSKSDAESLRQYNGRNKYNEWVFVATQASIAAGVGGARGARPGQPVNAPGRGSATPRGRSVPGIPPMSSPFGGGMRP